MKVNRNKVAIAGGIGLFSNILLTTACYVIRYFWLPPLIPQPKIAWILFIVLGLIALIEIPLMIFGLKKMASGSSKAAKAANFAVSGFVFFAAVYALPNLLLTNFSLIWMGLVLAGTSLLRFGASVFFLNGD